MDDDEELERLLAEFGIRPTLGGESKWPRLDDLDEIGDWNDEQEP